MLQYSTLVLSPGALQSLNIRRLFFDTSVSMMASRPLFGVGVGQYSLWSTHFAPPELLEIYQRENAHNYFLQVGGELGSVGLVIFVWLLGSALWSAWPGAQVIRRAPLAAGLLAGLSAFLFTCLSGHPLLIPEVMYPFWIALGLAAAAGGFRVSFFERDTRTPPERRARVPGSTRQRRQHLGVRRVVVVATTIIVFASIPIRVAREIREVDMTRVTYGFHPWKRRRPAHAIGGPEAVPAFMFRRGPS